MSADVVPMGLHSLKSSPASTVAVVPAPVVLEASDTAIDHYADLLSALSLGPLSAPMIDAEGGLRFEWSHTDAQGQQWDLRAVIEASGGLYLVALGPTAAHDNELYLEKFDALLLISFVATGFIPHG